MFKYSYEWFEYYFNFLKKIIKLKEEKEEEVYYFDDIV